MNQLYEEALTRRIKSEIAKEIHDELGNVLAVISSKIKVAKLKLQQNDQLEPEFFDTAEDAANKLLNSTKDFIWTVGSSDENPENIFFYLKDIGEELFDDANVRFYAEIKKKNDRSIRFNVQQSYQIVLMFKEALTNIAKHSLATEVNFKMILEDDLVILDLKDDGVGFDQKVKTISSGNSFGLKNIRHRAQKAGGSVKITSKSNLGTRVNFRLTSESFNYYADQSEHYLPRQAS